MKAKELRNFLNKIIERNSEAECFINGSGIGVNADDECNVDLYEVAGNDKSCSVCGNLKKECECKRRK